MKRRFFLSSLLASSAVAITDPFRVYSFSPPRPLYSLHLIADGQVIQGWEPRERVNSFYVPFGYRKAEVRRTNSSIVWQLEKHRDSFATWVSMGISHDIVA